MPNKKKLKLANLTVTSFITSEESNNVKGRDASAETNCIAETCIYPCTGEPLTITCPPRTNTCNTRCGTCFTNCGTCESCPQCNPSIGTNIHEICLEPFC